MRYNVWIINDVIEKGGELIWRGEKFSPFFPIDLGLSPYTSNPIYIGVKNVSNLKGIKLKLDDRDNPDIVLYEPGDNQEKLLGRDRLYKEYHDFTEFQNKVKQPFANKEYLIGQIRNTIPIENGRLVENGGIRESSYGWIVEKIRLVTYPFVRRLIGYGVIEEVYEVRIRDREMMIENRKYIYHRVRMTPVFKVPREINNKAYKIIDDTDVSLTIVYKINYVVNIEAKYIGNLNNRSQVKVEVKGYPALELKRIGYGE